MVLVVGGAGYIGSHMVQLLRGLGADHLVFDNLSSGHKDAVQGSRFVEGDLADAAQLRKLLEEEKVDAVMHFAASISVGESVREPYKYWRNNHANVLNLLEAMRATNVSKFIFSSTAALFGNPDEVPIPEGHRKAPTSPYGNSKAAVEKVLEDADVAFGLKSVCLRYFNAAGADPEGRIGEDHRPEEHLIPVAIEAAMGKRPALKVFGTDYPTPDGTCVRDYVHICDLAQAHLLALQHLRKGGESRQYNLGNGEGFSVRQVIDMVEKVSGKKVPNEDAPRRPGDPAILVAASNRIRNDWGWSPAYPELGTIVEHAWKWHSSHPDGYGS